MKFKLVMGVVLIATMIFIAGCSGVRTSEVAETEGDALFESASCGCCGGYISDMQDQGFDIPIVITENLDKIKSEFNIPLEMRSCHTARIGNYFVEGHMPLEAIEKLKAEQPDIAGIALPGMPSGAPGMPGEKNEPWVVYAIHHDGSTEEFMTV